LPFPLLLKSILQKSQVYEKAPVCCNFKKTKRKEGKVLNPGKVPFVGNFFDLIIKKVLILQN